MAHVSGGTELITLCSSVCPSVTVRPGRLLCHIPLPELLPTRLFARYTLSTRQHQDSLKHPLRSWSHPPLPQQKQSPKRRHILPSLSRNNPQRETTQNAILSSRQLLLFKPTQHKSQHLSPSPPPTTKQPAPHGHTCPPSPYTAPKTQHAPPKAQHTKAQQHAPPKARAHAPQRST